MAKRKPVSAQRNADSAHVLLRDMLDALRAAGVTEPQISKVMLNLRTRRRAITTSTPVQSVRTGEHEHLLDARQHTPESLQRVESRRRRKEEAERLYEQALALEESDPEAAQSGYLAVLKKHSAHLEARINLGRLLHMSGRLDQAEQVYRRARHASALLSFNLAILLEDMNREPEALEAYRTALSLDPTLHDAHFNLSLLHERAGRERDAFRHLLAYRRHRLKHDDGE
jgi:tetratricopeptide (TPR) repeat protein